MFASSARLILAFLVPISVTAQAAASRTDQWFERSPLLTIRPIGDGVEADHVAPSVLFGDTLVVWFERTESRVRLLNLRSGASRTFGRAGQGPFEFTQIGRVQGWSGDSILVLDDAQARGTILSVTTGRGRLIRYFDADSTQGAQLVGRLRSGAIVTVVRSNSTQDGPDGLFKMPGQYRILARERMLRATAPFDGGSMVRLHSGNGASIMVAPLQVSSPSTLGRGQLVWIGERGDTLFRWSDAALRPTALPLNLPTQDLSAADRSRLMASWLLALKATGEQAAALRKVVVLPSRVPLTQSILVDTDDQVWLRFSRDASDRIGSSVVRINGDGEVTSCFRLDARQRLFGLGTAIVVVGTRTEDDVYEVGVASIPSQCTLRRSLSAKAQR